jgi:hypothetical protein
MSLARRLRQPGDRRGHDNRPADPDDALAREAGVEPPEERWGHEHLTDEQDGQARAAAGGGPPPAKAA